MPDPFDTPGSHPLFVVDGWVVCVYVSDRGSSVHMYRERRRTAADDEHERRAERIMSEWDGTLRRLADA